MPQASDPRVVDLAAFRRRRGRLLRRQGRRHRAAVLAATLALFT